MCEILRRISRICVGRCTSVSLIKTLVITMLDEPVPVQSRCRGIDGRCVAPTFNYILDEGVRSLRGEEEALVEYAEIAELLDANVYLLILAMLLQPYICAHMRTDRQQFRDASCISIWFLNVLIILHWAEHGRERAKKPSHVSPFVRTKWN